MTNTIPKSWRQLAKFALGTCFALVAACSGDSPGTTEPTPKPTPSPTANGVVVITVTGLDATQPADIVLTGPAAFSRSLTSSGTVSGLAAGRYTISARVIASNGLNYVPAAATQFVDVGSDGVPVAATVAYRAETGVVIVSVSGLPGGEPAHITLTPPSGPTISIAVTRQLDDVLPGRWRLDAAPVASGGHTYRPTPSNYDVTLAGSDTARMPVEYKLSTGGIAIAVSGLPNGTNASLLVTGPGGFSQVVTGTTTLTDLVPGEYFMSAAPVNVGALTFAPTPTERALTVTASLVAEPLIVRYKQLLGRLEISTTGLPASVTPTFTLSGNGVSRALTGAGVVDSLLLGSYTMAAATLTNGATTYTPTPTTQSVAITAGTSTASFAYAASASPASLGISVSGLAAGVAADILVTGPNGFSQTVTASTTLGSVAPGSYTILARNVRTALGAFGATPATREVSVAAGGSATNAVAYTALPAVVLVTVSGVPVGASPAITVTPPSGFAFVLAATTTMSPAATGRWRLSAAQFLSGGNTFTASTASYDQNLLAGDTLRFPVSYTSSAPVTGSLSVAINGLPIGASGNVSVSGPGGFAQTVASSSTLQNLAPGSYTLNANAVTGGTDTYAPSPSSTSVSVAVGATASATFTYASSSGSGANLAIENVYVTQAAQNWSGTAPIVTGRDALVRVFVKASAANTMQPDVRLRVYEGGTLIQTATISAPVGSVPTSVSEGSLGSSWNLRIAAANVRAGLRVLADVDPANAIGESNRGDNTWPSDGTPATIPTANVPALTVKFVPVTLNGVTGNVTDANKDQFLTTTRLIMPVQAVSSSVRAAFTSSAAPLESSNGNSAWSTVLSEINALRAADGAAANVHYYGVVKAGYSSGVAGIAYVPGRAAVGWDALPSGDRVAAHELGHNFSRPHTPCGVSGDGAYPYSGGTTGVYGWNSTTNALVAPSWTDIMGYCNNQWISDWTWTKVIEYRSASGFGTTMASAGDGLLIWGRVTDGRAVLEPAFRVHARPTPRPSKSNYHVVLSDANGSPLVDVPIEPQVVDHVNDHDERQFAVVVPWSDALERAIARMSVVDARSPFGSATRASASVLAAGANASLVVMPDPAVNVTTVSANRSGVAWNSARYPMAMVRDAATGEILSFLRSSGDGFSVSGKAVDIVFSDGVRSLSRRVTPTR